VAVTARFRVLFVFVVMEVGRRRILHCNVTAHPTADWTLQQLREAIPSDHSYGFLIHDRDSIFSSDLDEELRDTFGLRVLRTPVRAPAANAYCERPIGTVGRECLDFIIPVNERHLRGSLRSCIAHYNKGRPLELRSGNPGAAARQTCSSTAAPEASMPRGCQIRVEDILAGYIMNIGWNNASLKRYVVSAEHTVSL